MMKRRIYENLPDDLVAGLSTLGRDISVARRARKLSQEDFARRLNVGRRTVARMEKGDERVSFGAYLAAAWIMNLESNLLSAFDVDRDPVQRMEARNRLPERIDRARAPAARESEAEPISAHDNGIDF